MSFNSAQDKRCPGCTDRQLLKAAVHCKCSRSRRRKVLVNPAGAGAGAGMQRSGTVCQRHRFESPNAMQCSPIWTLTHLKVVHIKLLECTIPPRVTKNRWRYPGNKKSYQRSASGQMTKFFRASTNSNCLENLYLRI